MLLNRVFSLVYWEDHITRKQANKKIASDNADILFDVLPDYGSMSKWKTFANTVDGQSVDPLVCIRHPDAVAFSSTSYYDNPSKYKNIAYTAYIPVPIRPSLNAIYIPKGVSYIIREYLRDLMYLNHTVTVIAPKMVYENAVGGKNRQYCGLLSVYKTLGRKSMDKTMVSNASTDCTCCPTRYTR